MNERVLTGTDYKEWLTGCSEILIIESEWLGAQSLRDKDNKTLQWLMSAKL